ncbi:MAG: hypothetical protein AAGJ81_12185 [Verrucomicrobiota bacterium]
MKQKSALSTVIGIVAIGIFVFAKIPRYHTFAGEDFDIEGNTYYIYEIESSGTSEVRVTLDSTQGIFDAYLVDESQLKVIEAWMESDDMDQPVFNTLGKWENVTSVNQDGITMAAGNFYLIIDNTILGSPESDSNVIVSMKIAEKY